MHKLKSHIEPSHLEYLPYHFLLASSSRLGFLKYHDISTGSIVAGKNNYIVYKLLFKKNVVFKYKYK